MNSFNEHILDFVDLLRIRYKNTRTCVIVEYPMIEIVKFLRDQEVSMKLIFDGDNETFEIKAPDQKFYSKVSHYDFRMVERRWTRDKQYIFSLIKDLKYCGLWKYISNKDFLVVNPHNEKAKPKELKTILKKIISDELPK
jgi:hypothetical protein